MSVDEIAVLACSRKWGGRCVAGISIETGRWLRPVSRPSRNGLGPYYWRIDGRAIRALDVVCLSHEGGLDDPSQPENALVDGSRWRLTGRLESTDATDFLARHVVQGPVLLGNRGTGRPRPRVGFALDGETYDLALTDYQVAPKLMNAGLGVHEPVDIGLAPGASLYLTVSLAEAREGWCTKLVAAVIPLPRGP